MTLTSRRGLRAAMVLTATAALALTGCTTNTEGPQDSGEPRDEVSLETDEEIAALVPAEIRDKGAIVIGTNPPYAPNEFKNESGEIVGFDIDVLTAAAQLMGLRAEFRESDFEKIIPAIEGGTMDMGASSFTVNDERLQTVDFVTYFEAGIQWAAAAGNDVDPDDACGLNVAVQRTTVSDQEDVPARSEACVAAGKPAIEKVQFDSQDEASTAVALGKVDAMSADSPISAYAVKQSEGKMQLVGDVFDSAPYGWPVRKDSELAAALEAAADKLIETGDFETIAQNWGLEAGLIDDAEIRKG
ncbi:ABC transporter substrate-binding protein [Dietzia maris]|jgi:polar amino acid transport system substrate-binding protein|uniref:ABC transporter substrate-binding protein n=1 Tax=Dietzia TaxID=37914 RepID=UPI000E80DAC8|nr:MULTISPECIES: ABC transporter substrate-binding protein [Dietzia]HBD22099.1 ABC transporter substrate-binding protein [Dietzia sp.]MBB0997487.1 ABC transporter substrate-binding protein [Dietzia maris]MCZ4539811.1 ABC transporter substrate-binding protein [Dietzia maris]MCZ4656710.1 ABC transporter substrate-binding protein [Dietzia kunjamensis]MDJ0423066.1 ABC transporter substrate-binding protein [Dietzia kunjamensis]